MTSAGPSRNRELALGNSLPVLLEYRNGRRWRISAGLLVEGLLLSLILTIPLLFPDRFPAVQLAQVSPPIWRGDWEGNANVKEAGGGNATKPEHKPRPDLDNVFFPPPGDHAPVTPAMGTGPEIGNGPGHGERYGDPAGPEFGRPPDGPVQVAPTNVPPPPDGVVDLRRYSLQPPRLLRRVEPDYPQLALAAHIEGDVVLSAIIDTDGRVRQVTVKAGHPALTQAAQAAVAQWLYEPTVLNGQPVAVQLDVTVKFRLNR